jgi:ribonuclease HII
MRCMAGCVPDVVTMGLDEAGRGPVLGPMVMAGVCVRTRAAAALTRAGVLDSKSFGAGDEAHERRLELERRIRAVATSVVVRVIEVEEIDRRVRLHELNVLEREHAAVIIERSAPAKRIIADGKRMFRALAGRFKNLEARDRAEEHHVAVAAASICAKVRRDELFRCIARRYQAEFGPIGGWGYENPPTHAFLRAYFTRYGRLPPEARRSWPWTTDYLPPNYEPFAELPASAQLGQLALVS